VTLRPVDSPEFRRWFGASKVVDEAGDPLIVWHASPPRIDVFYEFDPERVVDIGFHFGTEKAASEFGKPRPFYLSVQNPIRLEDPGDWFERSGRTWSVQDQLARDGLIDRRQYEAIHAAAKTLQVEQLARGRTIRWTQERANLSEKLRRILLDKGIDGAVYTNEAEDVGSTSWIAFFPTQIKAAVGNRGTFDPNDPNILHGLARRR
jgi:hypothetical protein